MYYIFAFKSRTGAIRFYEAVNKEKIRASLVNTPSEIGIGCGLSVKIFDLAAGRRVVSGGYSNFYGVYSAENQNGRTRFTRI